VAPTRDFTSEPGTEHEPLDALQLSPDRRCGRSAGLSAALIVPAMTVALLATAFACCKSRVWQASQALLVRNEAASTETAAGPVQGRGGDESLARKPSLR